MATQTSLVTYDDYRALPDDRNRYEIIAGELLMTAAPTTIHQRILRKLFFIIGNFVEDNDLGEVLSAPVDVVLSMTNVVQPDLLFVAKDREQIITKKNIVNAPDLVVEIISDYTEAVDRKQKKQLYEKYEVKEYWIVYPEDKKAEQFLLQDQKLILQEAYERTDSLKSAVLQGLSVDLSNIFSD